MLHRCELIAGSRRVASEIGARRVETASGVRYSPFPGHRKSVYFLSERAPTAVALVISSQRPR